jgi:hypothetical protein
MFEILGLKRRRLARESDYDERRGKFAVGIFLRSWTFHPIFFAHHFFVFFAALRQGTARPGKRRTKKFRAKR